MLVYSSTLQIEPKEIWNIWFAFSRMTKNNENNKTEFDQNKKHKAEIRNNISKNQIQLRLLIWFNSCLLFFFYLRMLCLFLHCFLCPWNSLLKHNTIIRNVHVSLVLIINHYEWKKRLSCISVLVLRVLCCYESIFELFLRFGSYVFRRFTIYVSISCFVVEL